MDFYAQLLLYLHVLHKNRDIKLNIAIHRGLQNLLQVLKGYTFLKLHILTRLSFF